MENDGNDEKKRKTMKNDEKQRQTMKSNENRRQTMKTDEETIGKVCTLGFGSWVAKPSISIELRPR